MRQKQEQSSELCLAIGQADFVVGDLQGNRQKLLDMRKEAADADLLLTPELSLCGYPPEDLLFREDFLDACEAAVDSLAESVARTPGPALLLGAPARCDQSHFCQPDLYNSVFFLGQGERKRLDKCFLPNYEVFDERRYFRSGKANPPLFLKGRKLGVLICEDIWTPEGARAMKKQGADILISLSASPFEQNKAERRLAMARARCQETGLPFVFVNTVGGQDEIVFDGGSFAFDGKQQQVLQMPFFCEQLTCLRWEGERLSVRGKHVPPPPALPSPLAMLYRAVTKGLQDYASKNGFRRVVLGLSGGIDSALCALIACDALGAASVDAIFMPSPYTSKESREDATALAAALGIRLQTIDIAESMESVHRGYEKGVGCSLEGIAAENLQARLRGLILMAFANSSGAMLLATGNKSEFATGYTTLYGDMCGGYAPLKDVYKTEVYTVARWRNERKGLVPARIFDKAPSAELRDDQRDDQSLPSYDLLDATLFELLEGNKPPSFCREGAIARAVDSMLLRAEHKRRQGPLGTRISKHAFGRDRRYPISHRFSSSQ